MKLSQIAAAADGRRLTVRASNCRALNRPRSDTLTQADGATHVVAGTAWSGVAMLEFPVFSETLSIVVS
jgi:hypothetical protein